MKKVLLFLFLTTMLCGCKDPISNENFDVVILNGRVMDPETNFDAVRNVGIKDGRIISITEENIIGAETIDASGHVVAPGFIDYEQHGLDPFGIKLIYVTVLLRKWILK